MPILTPIITLGISMEQFPVAVTKLQHNASHKSKGTLANKFSIHFLVSV